MDYLKRFTTTEKYKATSFILVQIGSNKVKLDFYDPIPSNYEPGARDVMLEVKGANAADTGAWFLATCDFDETNVDNPARTRGHFFPVYYKTNASGPITGAGAHVAAPCPPFCEGQTGD